MTTRTERFAHPDGTTSYYRIEDRPLDESGHATHFPRPPAATVFPPRGIGWWSRKSPVEEVLRLDDLPNHNVSYTVHGLTVRSALGQVDTAMWYHPVASDGDAAFLPVVWESIVPTNHRRNPMGVSYEDIRARDPQFWLKNTSRRELCGCGCGQLADRKVREGGRGYTQDSLDYDAGEWSCRIPRWAVTGPELWKLMNSGAAND